MRNKLFTNGLGQYNPPITQTYNYYAQPMPDEYWYIIWDIEGIEFKLLIPFVINQPGGNNG